MTEVLSILVGLSLLVQAYHYAGYPLVLLVLSRLAPRPVRKAAVTPSASLVISCYNEAGIVGEKLENSLTLDYPDLEIVVNSEGSTDATPDIVRGFAERGITAMHSRERRGKSAAMNDAAARATGEILVFSDANVLYDRAAIGALVANFADPDVGLVTGCKEVRSGRRDAANAAGAEGFYWRYENAVKSLETTLHSTVAVHGEMLAIRRELFTPIPAGTVNDDAYLAMTLLAEGYRVVYEPAARGWEAPSRSLAEDGQRRRRMSAGRFQLLGRRDLISRLPGRVLFMFLSHKVLRLALPVVALIGLAANVAAVARPDVHPVLWLLLLAQVSALALAGLGVWGGEAARRFLPAKISAYVVSGYVSGLYGIGRALAGRQTVLWDKAAR